MGVRFNLNDYWRIKLTPDAMKVLDAEDAETIASFPRLNADWRASYKPDSEGYINMQGWVVMQTFGPHLCLGIPSIISPVIELVDGIETPGA